MGVEMVSDAKQAMAAGCSDKPLRITKFSQPGNLSQVLSFRIVATISCHQHRARNGKEKSGSDSNTVHLEEIEVNLRSSCITNWRLYGKNQSSAAHGHTNR